MSLIWLMLSYFATCSIVNKAQGESYLVDAEIFATCSIVNKAQGESYLVDA